MNAMVKLPARLKHRPGTLGGAVDSFVAEGSPLSDGQEADVREERRKKLAAALEEVVTDHRDLFALLAR